jgi:membrane-bound serine protease (ClpP class)
MTLARFRNSVVALLRRAVLAAAASASVGFASAGLAPVGVASPTSASEAPQPASEAPHQGAGVPSERKASRVALLPITGAIDDVTLWSLERRLAAARDAGFDAVVLEIDTPGGEVGAMLDICLRIKSDAPSNTVAWIRPKAFSAGTFIALSCRELVVAPGSVFGDAAPIAVMPGIGLAPLPAAERAKQESPLLDELDAAAARRGDDPRLLHAFVAVERELWLVERASDGARRFVDRAELDLLGLASAETPQKPTGTDGQRPRLPADAPLAAAAPGEWRIIETVDTADRLLVVQADEAIRWGLAAAEVKDEAALKDFFLADEVVRFPESWSESLVRFMVSWPMRIVLIAIFIVALVIEVLHPGVGAAGAVALVALVALVGAPGLLGLAEWWEILLVLAGIVLIGVEVLVLPGMAVAGIAGALCVLVGLIASFTGTDPTSAGERSALLTASTTTIAGIVLGAILTWFASRWFRETWVFRRAVLSAAVDGTHGAPIRGEPSPPPPGTRGIADSDLRPAGRARFGELVFDAQSTGAYITRGTRIEVIGRSGQTVLVEGSAGEPADPSDTRARIDGHASPLKGPENA